VEYVLTESNITAPVDIHITRITPPKVMLSIEELIEKTLPVQVRRQGEVQKGFLLDSIEITPSFVRVRGAKSQLASLETVATMVIDLSELNHSTEMIIQLDLPPHSLQILDEGVEFYTAQVNLRSLPVKKRFDNVPVYLRNTAYVSVINPNVFNIFVEGPAEVVKSLNVSGLYGVIDLRKYKPGVYNKVKPTPILPEEVNILEQWPPISLWVKKETLEKSEKLKQRVQSSGFSARQR
jgi:YbbR domain-containing protein